MDYGLKDKVVLITGASQGIARSAAELFAAEGAKLAICSRNEKSIREAEQQLAARGATVMSDALDATDTAAVERFVARTVEFFGRVDVAISNAGGPPAKNFLSTTMEEWRKATELNFLSVVALAKAVLPHMQRNRWGRFLAITSVTVKMPIENLVLSNAVRPAVVGLLKSLAVEFGRDNITFNNVGPGYTTTERLKSLVSTRALAAGVSVEEMYRQWSAEVPMARLAQPEEVADALLWLASERSSYVTGQTIIVDGGRYRGLA